jgi:hypothetical protein
MARFYGPVGYGSSVERPEGSGIWVDEVEEYYYSGDVIRSARRLDEGQNLNNDLSVVNRISIVANQYANQHFFNIKYVGWMGALWTVTNVEVQAPRLILTMGSVYNGPTP